MGRTFTYAVQTTHNGGQTWNKGAAVVSSFVPSYDHNDVAAWLAATTDMRRDGSQRVAVWLGCHRKTPHYPPIVTCVPGEQPRQMPN
ncbi:hypothetical protein ACFY05_32190 [Microtetraspora fusca]|uniref:Uncharacterized protein n=1 Tax=Microtetraspora fusca TaxID=1997 RepID=A0ABW6VG22_MICFU